MGVETKPTPLPADGERLAGTVKPYRRHLALCTGGPPELWLARIEEMEGIAKALRRALSARGRTKEIKVTACDEPSFGVDGMDIFLLPDMLRLCDIKEEMVESLVEALVSGLGHELPCTAESLPPGQHIFVCVHQNRDERCGHWGPPFHDALTEELRASDIAAHVHRTSHIGGHRLAAVCIIYPEGVWYGRLRPENAGPLVEQHLQEGRILVEHYRGRIDTTVCRQVAEAEAAAVLSRTYPNYRRLEIEVDEAGQQATAVVRAVVPTTAGKRVVNSKFSLSCPHRRWTADDDPVFIMDQAGDRE